MVQEGDSVRSLGRRVEHALNGRFQYCQLLIDRQTERIAEGLDMLRRSLLLWKL